MRVDRTMLFALLLIGIGVLLLLQQAEVLPEGVGIWPIVLIGVGVVLLVERLAAGGAGGSGLVVPLVVIAIGTGFLLEDAGVIEDDDVLLPLVAIAIGVGLVLGAVPARRPTGGREEVALETVPVTRTKVMINLADPSSAFSRRPTRLRGSDLRARLRPARSR